MGGFITTLEMVLDACEKDPVMLYILRPRLQELLNIIDNPSLRPVRQSNQYDLVAHLHRQRDFSQRTFGPGERTAGVISHIRKELLEIEAAPNDLFEWIDVVLLALDGASRAGFKPEQIAQALEEKLARNEARNWPDWRSAKPGEAIEHVREQIKHA